MNQVEFHSKLKAVKKADRRKKNLVAAAKKAKAVIKAWLMKINNGHALLRQGAKLKQGALDSLGKLLQKTLSLAHKNHFKIKLDLSSGWPVRSLAA